MFRGLWWMFKQGGSGLEAGLYPGDHSEGCWGAWRGRQEFGVKRGRPRLAVLGVGVGGGYRKAGSSREQDRRLSLPLTLQMAQDVLGQSWVVVRTPAVPGGRREAVRGTWLGVWSLEPFLDTPWKYPTGDRGDTGSRPGDSPTGWSQQGPSPRYLRFGRP